MPASNGANAQPASPAKAEDASGEAMPCCPVKSESEASMECSASAMQCCAWHHSDTDVFAVLFASDHPQPKHIAAVLPVAASAAPPLMARAHVPGLGDDLPFVKPVTQKKTDLRI